MGAHCQALHLDLVVPPKDEPWARIRGMVQDPQGFLWLATDDGLLKYDGYKCTTYHNEPNHLNSLGSNWIESIYGGQENFLLLGTFGAGLDQLDLSSGKFTHHRYNAKDPATLSNDTVTAIVKDWQGMFWIGTHNGLNRFDPRSGKFTHYKNDPRDSYSLSDNQVRVLFVDHQGVLWIGTQSPWVHDGGTRAGGLNRFDPRTGKFLRYLHDSANPHSLVDNQITALFEDSRGTFWVGTAGDGLHTMNKETGVFERHPYDPADPGKLSRPPAHNVNTTAVTDYITFIAEDKAGNIWIGTLNGGINVYNYATQRVSYYGSEMNSGVKLDENRFGAAYRSRDGIFWIASQGRNLYKVNPYKVALPYHRLGKIVSDFYEDDSGVLWIATDQGFLRRNKDGGMQLYLIDEKGFSISNVITDLEGDNQHNLWVGTLEGLYRFNTITQTFTSYHHEAGREASLLSDTITSLTKANNNTLWVGTANGLDLLDISSGAFTHYKSNPKDSTSLGSVFLSDEGQKSVWSTAMGADNSLWVCIGGGINRLNERTGHFQKYAISDVVINSVKKDSKGGIWAATNAGLYKYDQKSDAFIAFNDLLRIINRNTGIFDLSEDRDHHLWLKKANGFMKLDADKKEVSVYTSKEQGFSWFSRKSYATKEGEILSGDTAGYFAFQPSALLGSLQSPSIVITGFSILDEPVVPARSDVFSEPVYDAKQIELKYNQNIFSFAFTSIDFTGSNEERNFLFRLENYDKNWHRADAEQTANYYNIPPGNYTFKVKVANGNGIWAEKTISVIISPPWWTTWWAYSLYGLGFITAIYMGYRLQKQRVIKAERSRARERELTQAKEIEKAYRELKATQAQLIQKEKMASLGELTAGIAHEIQNPLNFVNNFSEINSELIDEAQSKLQAGNYAELSSLLSDVKSNEQKIMHHGKRAEAIVTGMLQHSRTSTGIKQPTDINALVEEYLKLSYHGMRAKNKSFESQLQTNFDSNVGEVAVVPQEIGRVLLNLFNNAFYAVNEKKKQLNGSYEPTVVVRTKRLNGTVEIQITDNGTGIPPRLIDKIFQPFFTNKPTGEGTGLGLSLSYDIVTKGHSGKLTVESEEGQSTNFFVRLPT